MIPGIDHFFSGVEVDHLTVSVLRTVEGAVEERTRPVVREVQAVISSPERP